MLVIVRFVTTGVPAVAAVLAGGAESTTVGAVL